MIKNEPPLSFQRGSGPSEESERDTSAQPGLRILDLSFDLKALDIIPGVTHSIHHGCLVPLEWIEAAPGFRAHSASVKGAKALSGHSWPIGDRGADWREQAAFRRPFPALRASRSLMTTEN